MIGAFIRGLIEFRQSVTTNYSYPQVEAYDYGRDVAHRLTFRVWDY